MVTTAELDTRPAGVYCRNNPFIIISQYRQYQWDCQTTCDIEQAPFSLVTFELETKTSIVNSTTSSSPSCIPPFAFLWVIVASSGMTTLMQINFFR
mmetsp:Transcript_2124/g.3906  ORF Transcript_2124/g.3906 Transcript_2124/m.3906 type:complete len:96 (+) Transcript_2124:23-310(+)